MLPTPAVDMLQSVSQSQHMRLGLLPFFQAARDGQLTLHSYAGLLKAMAIVQGMFEHAATHTDNPRLAAVWDDHLRKLPLIQHDLDHLQSHSFREIAAAQLRGHVMAEHIRLRSYRDPVSLLGYMYVLAIWNLAGAGLSGQIAHSCQLDDVQALSYLSSFDSWGQAHWDEFAQRLNLALPDEDERHRVAVAIQEALDGIERIIDALHPINTYDLSNLSTSLNPMAGNHQIAGDLRELQAAMRAGEVTWLEFPYYELRYGTRGRHFTWSDSAWLTSLSEMNMEKIQQQVLWLGGLLSNRGMPQWLLERHLIALYHELTAAAPEKQEGYEKLLQASYILRDIRLAHISDEAFWSLAHAFEAQVAPEWNVSLRGTGEMLVSAVADEKAGIEYAVSSIESWMTDPERFPAWWINAVRTTIQQARAVAI